jgi:hypothetical protein
LLSNIHILWVTLTIEFAAGRSVVAKTTDSSIFTVDTFFPKVLDSVAIFVKTNLRYLTLTLTLRAGLVNKVIFKC